MDLKSIVSQSGADKPIQPTDMISEKANKRAKQTNQSSKPTIKHPNHANHVGYGVVVYREEPDERGVFVVTPEFATKPNDQLNYEDAERIRDAYRSCGLRAVAIG